VIKSWAVYGEVGTCMQHEDGSGHGTVNT